MKGELNEMPNYAHPMQSKSGVPEYFCAPTFIVAQKSRDCTNYFVRFLCDLCILHGKSHIAQNAQNCALKTDQ